MWSHIQWFAAGKSVALVRLPRLGYMIWVNGSSIHLISTFSPEVVIILGIVCIYRYHASFNYERLLSPIFQTFGNLWGVSRPMEPLLFPFIWSNGVVTRRVWREVSYILWFEVKDWTELEVSWKVTIGIQRSERNAKSIDVPVGELVYLEGL